MKYDVRETEAEGRGAFASQKITSGEVIMTEKPLLRAPSRDSLVKGVAGTLDTFITLQYTDSRRKDDDWKTRAALSDADIAQGIVQHNCFISDDGSEALLFLKVSMFNHSCSPNSYVSTDDGAFSSLSIVAARDIAYGEQIYICYSSAILLCSKSIRHAALQSQWGFDCHCTRCNATTTIANEENSFWLSLERAAVLGSNAKPRHRVMDPDIQRMHKESLEACERLYPHLLPVLERLKADVEYFG
jgi:SET domain-containing protein